MFQITKITLIKKKKLTILDDFQFLRLKESTYLYMFI